MRYVKIIKNVFEKYGNFKLECMFPQFSAINFTLYAYLFRKNTGASFTNFEYFEVSCVD